MTTFLVLCFCLLSSVLGQTWSALGNGVPGDVRCMAVYNGELYVGGYFDGGPGQPNRGVLKWDGTNFVPVPGDSILGDGDVWDMIVYNNELIVGGGFSRLQSNSPAQVDHVARWNGTSWDSLENGLNNRVFALEVYNGKLILGGDFTTSRIGTDICVLQWDGNTFQSMQGGIISSTTARVYDLSIYNGELYVTGDFQTIATNSAGIQRWNGTTWSDAGPGGINGNISGLVTHGNHLYAGGRYVSVAGGVPVADLARWDGNTWSTVGSGFGFGLDFERLNCLASFQGDLYAGGEFTSLGGVPCRSIGRYDGASWDSLGSGVDSVGIVVDSLPLGPFPPSWLYLHAPGEVETMLEWGGALYVGGRFNMIGGVQAHSVAKWTPAAVGVAEAPPAAVVPYPHPVDVALSLAHLQLDAPAPLELVDASGKVVLRRQSFAGEAIPTGHLANGLYLLRILDAVRPVHLTIVVQH